MKLLSLLILSLVVLSACQQEPVPEKSSSATTLVTVNGQAITDVDLLVTMEKLFSRGPAAPLFSAEIEGKALESMVKMMVIAQAAEREASEQQLEEVDAKVRRYREELLTEIYLRQHGNVAPPTQAEIIDYYENNKTLFGEKPIKHIAVIRTKAQPANSELQSVLQQIQLVREKDDWSNLAANLKTQNSPLEYLTLTTDIPQLDKSLLRATDSLEQGQVSNVVYIDNRPHLVKLLKVTTQSAQPLETVKNQIRKTLAAKKLKQQIKTISDQLLAKAEVIYLNQEQE